MSEKTHRVSPTDQVNVTGIIFTHDDIRRVIDRFYRQVAEDPQLKIPFQSVHDWPEHTERLTLFWWIRFGGKPYMFSEFNPIQKHFYAGFNEALLKRWLELFHQSLKAELRPEQAEFWEGLSVRMGQSLNARNELLKSARDNKPE